MARNNGNSGHGMILGKFMPPHAGHQYLVEFARHFCGRLTVLVCSLEREPIPGELRYGWMRELFPHLNIVHVTDDLPQEPCEHPQFWNLWREAIGRVVSEPINYVFASEPYGVRLAEELNATFIPVDVGRQVVPVSGTAIRAHPADQWQYIPECVRPYFVKRVCLFGPESTGKSTLAEQLAKHFQTVYVPEFARGWLDPKKGICDFEDIPIIARGQIASEQALARQANRVLICDTDVLTTTIWSDVLFGSVPEWMVQQAQLRPYDLSLLLDVDVPWADDSQRYLPDRRQEFFDRCRQALIDNNRPFVTVRGTWEQRFDTARDAVDELFKI